MAVYTVLQSVQIDQLLLRYAVGRLLRYDAVADGIENTNYFISVSAGDPADSQHTLLLTIFEHIDAHDLEFYLGWLAHLYDKGLPIAPAIKDRREQRIQQLKGKPAALFSKLAGGHPTRINIRQCHAIGTALGQIHIASQDIGGSHAGPRSMPWLTALAHATAPKLTPAQQRLLHEALAVAKLLQCDATLPRGLIHGDLFPDNTLFVGDQLTGLVDFFSGGEGLLAFDLAVAINAWCSDSKGHPRAELQEAMMAGYQQQRPLTDSETQQWTRLLATAALRFWVSRLDDSLQTDSTSAIRKTKDPLQYEQILAGHLAALDGSHSHDQ